MQHPMKICSIECLLRGDFAIEYERRLAARNFYDVTVNYNSFYLHSSLRMTFYISKQAIRPKFQGVLRETTSFNSAPSFKPRDTRNLKSYRNDIESHSRMAFLVGFPSVSRDANGNTETG